MQSFDSLYSTFGSRIADLPGFGTNWGSFAELGMHQYEESVWNATHGLGFNPNEHYGGRPGSRFTGYGLIYGNGTRVGGSWAYGEAVGHMEGGETLSLNWDDSTDDSTWNPQQQTHGPTAPIDLPTDCYNFYQLIYENPDVRKFMNDAWGKSAKSAEQVDKDRRTNSGQWKDRWAGAENGGIVTSNPDNITFWEYTGTEPPKIGSTPEIDVSDQIKNFVARDRKAGGTGIIALAIHTHSPDQPFQKPGPYSTAAELAALQTWDASVVTGNGNPSTLDYLNLGSDAFGTHPFFGIIVYGKDKFTVYGNGKTDIDTLKRTCVH